MNFTTLKEAASAAGITEIEVYKAEMNGLEISAFNGNIEDTKLSETCVLAVRGVYANQVVTIYEENATDESIPSIINKIIENSTIITKKEPFFIYEGDEIYPVLKEITTDFDAYTIKDKSDMLIELTSEVQNKSPYVKTVEVYYAENTSKITIENSNGLSVSRDTKNAVITAHAVCEKDGETKTGYDFVRVNQLKDADLNELAKKAVEDAVSGFAAQSIPSGSYKVVLDHAVVSSLIGAFSNVFCANAVLKNMSFLKDKINDKIFGSNITIIDDPLRLDAPSQDSFDDEGVASYTKKVVEEGVLKTYLHNLSTAAMMNTKTTGNGYKNGIAGSVSVSPSNLYLKPGKSSLEEIFTAVNDGVYITSIQGLHAGLNPISGSFNLQSSGFMIENGKKGKPITLIILSGTIQEMLNSVELVGNDFEFKRSVGAPSLYISSMAISGK